MNQFLSELRQFTQRVEAMPRFRGQVQAVRALKRIAGLTVFQ